MKHIVLLAALLACFFFTASSSTLGQVPTSTGSSLVLYDDFNGPYLDPTKWFDNSYTVGTLESVRELAPPYQGEGNNGRLHMKQRAYLNPGDAYTAGWMNLFFANAASIKEVAFSVAVNSPTLSQCPTNDTSFVRAGFTGRFFNYGRGSELDPDMDVNVDLNLHRERGNPTGPLIVGATVSANGPQGFWTGQNIGFAKVGQTVKLRVRWDQPNKQFLFQLNSDPVVAIPYFVSDGSPTFPVKAIGVIHGVPACPVQQAGGALIDAYFDNVYISVQ